MNIEIWLFGIQAYSHLWPMWLWAATLSSLCDGNESKIPFFGFCEDSVI